MPIQLKEEKDGTLLVIQVSGKLLKEDYAQFMPEFERLAQQHGKLRLLFDMNDFHGWGASAAWEDFKFGMKYMSAIERIAMVGEKQWQHGMAIFCKPFIKAEVSYFDQADAAQALIWLGEAYCLVCARPEYSVTMKANGGFFSVQLFPRHVGL